jgi:hypothetical protein
MNKLSQQFQRTHTKVQYRNEYLRVTLLMLGPIALGLGGTALQSSPSSQRNRSRKREILRENIEEPGHGFDIGFRKAHRNWKSCGSQRRTDSSPDDSRSARLRSSHAKGSCPQCAVRTEDDRCQAALRSRQPHLAGICRKPSQPNAKCATNSRLSLFS